MKEFYSQEAGNILFIILIVVILFAALSYAVSQSSTINENAGSLEQADTKAAAILQYGALVEQGVNKLRLVNRCATDQISFENSGWTTNDDSVGYRDTSRSSSLGTPPSNGSCNLFHPKGGGVFLRNFQNEIDTSQSGMSYYRTQPYFTGSARIIGIGTDGTAASNYELIMVIVNLHKTTCQAINKKLGFGNVSIPLVTNLISLNMRFGIRSYGENGAAWSDSGNILANRTAGCLEAVNHVGGVGLLANTFYFYQVLIPR